MRPASIALDQPLTGGRLEKAQMLARCRLADSDRLRRRREAATPLELDEKAQAGRIPEER